MSSKVIDNLSKKEFIILAKSSKSFNDMMRSLRITVNGINLSHIKRKANSFKLKIDFSKFKTKYNHSVNTSIFNKINSREKAYWIGFIASDGYVPKDSNRVTINISTKDENHLDKFIKFINGDLSAKYHYINKHSKPMVSYSISNKEFSNNIKKLGIVSPKSHKNLFLDFKKRELNLAYLLGYYDGDGSEGNTSICGSNKNFFKSIKKIV